MADIVRIRNAHFRLEQAVEAIRAAGDAYRQRRDQLKAETMWSADTRDGKIAEARDAALAQIEASRGEIAEARETLAAALKQADSEDRSTPVARERVQALLRGGADPASIMRRAADVGDVAMLEALRAEAAWISPTTGGQGVESSFDHAGFVRLIDLALLPLVDGDDRELKQTTALDGPRAVAQAEIMIETAGAEIETGPTLSTALALHFAGAHQENVEEEPPLGTARSLEEAVAGRSGSEPSGPA